MRQMVDRSDVVVIGAGPAGAMASLQCVRRGLGTVLIERRAFPRAKVCGCCLSGAACGLLDAAGLGGLLDDAGAITQSRIVLCSRSSRTCVPASGGRILSRGAFDAALVGMAEREGVEFRDQTRATAIRADRDGIEIEWRRAAGRGSIHAAVAIVADGIGGRLVDNLVGPRVQRRHGSIGIGAVLDATSSEIQAGEIMLALGEGGYVGLTRLETGEVDLAAAFRPSALQRAGDIRSSVSQIVRRCGLELSLAEDISWKGTATLAGRRKQLGGERVLIAGDAASYQEPITGEGIGLALGSGLGVADFAEQGVHRWHNGLVSEWGRAYGEIARRRQGLCAGTSLVLRSDVLAALVVRLLSYHPEVACHLTRMTARPFAVDALVRS